MHATVQFYSSEFMLQLYISLLQISYLYTVIRQVASNEEQMELVHIVHNSQDIDGLWVSTVNDCSAHAPTLDL